MSSNMFLCCFLRSRGSWGFWWKQSRIFFHIMYFSGLQTVEGRNFSFSAAKSVYKAYTLLFIIFKWPIVSLDKTLIHHLEWFMALWRCTETVILTFNRLESMTSTTCWDVFIKSLGFFSTEERNAWASWMTWGWVDYRDILIWKWTNPLRNLFVEVFCSGIDLPLESSEIHPL